MTSVLADVRAVGVATVQDGGRHGYASVGVPVAGAWHRGRYAEAVRLLTGADDHTTPTIEVLAGALVIRASVDLVIAVSGPAHFLMDSRHAAAGVVLRTPAGGELVVTPTGSGPVYVAVAGWTPSRTLGSCSVDTFSRLGGEPIAAGYRLVGSRTGSHLDRVGWFTRPLSESSGAIRIVALDDDVASAFTARRWRVQRTARSGTRFSANDWRGPQESMESFPVIPGAIQVTPDGEAIVLGPDGALTGGYPVVGVVASVDLDRISTLAIAADVTFARVDVTSAATAWQAAEERRAHSAAHPSLLG